MSDSSPTRRDFVWQRHPEFGRTAHAGGRRGYIEERNSEALCHNPYFGAFNAGSPPADDDMISPRCKTCAKAFGRLPA